jgi:hypothetical protein
LQFPNFTLRLSLKFHTDTGLAQQKGRSVIVNLNADSIHSTGLLTMRPLAFSKFLSETLCISLNVQRKANLNCAETQILCMYMVFLYQQTVLVDCEWYYFVTHTTLSTVCTRLQPQAHSLTSAPATASLAPPLLAWLRLWRPPPPPHTRALRAAVLPSRPRWSGNARELQLQERDVYEHWCT